jgi:hypothetical protein
MIQRPGWRAKLSHCHVNSDESETNHCESVAKFGALRSIAEGQEEAHHHKDKVKIVEDSVDNVNTTKIERLVLKRIGQYNEGDVKFPCVKANMNDEMIQIHHKTNQGKPREDQIECLIKHFDVDPEFARKSVRGTINVRKLHRTVNCLSRQWSSSV